MGEGRGEEGEEGGCGSGGEVHDEDGCRDEVRRVEDGIDLLGCSRFVRWGMVLYTRIEIPLLSFISAYFRPAPPYLRDSKSNPRGLSCVPIYLGMLCGSCVELLWEVGVDRQGWANETGMCIVSAR